MKKKFGCLGMILLLMLSLCACVIKSNKPISAKKLDNMKTEYENYLKDKYPNETFTVDIWQEYGEDIGGAGLPDYEGYLIRQVVTDSKGNRFKVFEDGTGGYSDDYQLVLDGTIQYDDKGERVFTLDPG